MSTIIKTKVKNENLENTLVLTNESLNPNNETDIEYFTSIFNKIDPNVIKNAEEEVQEINKLNTAEKAELSSYNAGLNVFQRNYINILEVDNHDKDCEINQARNLIEKELSITHAEWIKKYKSKNAEINDKSKEQKVKEFRRKYKNNIQNKKN